ncbi:hypothetical protein BJV74DRAFT_842926 [Russula compacta]|nr:hypothetical protein BJV74DRAFT_842926 [Russula compacta]
MPHLASAAKTASLLFLTWYILILTGHLRSPLPACEFWLQTLSGPLEINTFLPLHETTPESDRVKLTPYILSLHAKEYAEQAPPTPSYTTIS